MRTEIGRREAHAQAFGTTPVLLPGDPYDAVVVELLAAMQDGAQ
jgi:hypothetical protein